MTAAADLAPYPCDGVWRPATKNHPRAPVAMCMGCKCRSPGNADARIAPAKLVVSLGVVVLTCDERRAA